jgi:serine/threonine protein kinase
MFGMEEASQPDVIAGRYQLLGLLGRGGMGEVWDGQDLRLGRPVAVKVLRADLARQPELRRRFESEARAAAGLVHPNVVGVFDTGEHDGVPFIVMERLDGRTLADEIAGGPVHPSRVVSLGRDMLAALEAAHQAGIVHRDVKPGNVLLATGAGLAGAGLAVAKVADFGIAKAAEGLGQDLTETGQLMGTPAYLAPERLNGGQATVASDLFSVGVVLYEALTGTRPFHGDTPMSLAHAIGHDDPPRLEDVVPGIDPALARAVERALQKDPARRFESASEMAGSLLGTTEAATRPELTETSVDPLPGRRLEADPAPPARALPLHRTQRTAVIGVALLLVVAMIALLARDGDDSPTRADPATTSVTPIQPPSPETVPQPLDRALDDLEEAVRR